MHTVIPPVELGGYRRDFAVLTNGHYNPQV
jgi:hypothetical protein